MPHHGADGDRVRVQGQERQEGQGQEGQRQVQVEVSSGSARGERERIRRPEGDTSNSNNVECFYCHKRGHYEKDCQKWLADQGKGVNELDAEESEAQPSQLSVQAMEQARTVADWVWSLEVVEEKVGQLRGRGEGSPSQRGWSPRRIRRTRQASDLALIHI